MNRETYQSRCRTVLTLDCERRLVSGSEEALTDAIRRAADLRVYTEFRYDEHVDTRSDIKELVQEVSEFRVTYLLDDRWAAGFMTLRQPVEPPVGFGPRASMSYFLYNQDGHQAIARLRLDGQSLKGTPGSSPVPDWPDMPKNHQFDNWDEGTNAPSYNFVYDFETYRFSVRDDWTEVLSHTDTGEVVSGSLDDLVHAFADGAAVKLGVRGLCADLSAEPESAVGHEVFVDTGACYYQTERKIFSAGTHPLVRVKPAIPLKYESEGWDCGWLMVRSDGFVERWLVNPYTLKFKKSQARYPMRWFVR